MSASEGVDCSCKVFRTDSGPTYGDKQIKCISSKPISKESTQRNHLVIGENYLNLVKETIIDCSDVCELSAMFILCWRVTQGEKTTLLRALYRELKIRSLQFKCILRAS